jgi:hypothetical protein
VSYRCKKDAHENHAATIEDYLNKYKLADGEGCRNKRALYFRLFTCYLVSVSFWRMHRRFFHPTSLQFMFTLDVVGDQVTDAFKRFRASDQYAKDEFARSPKDIKLGQGLIELGAADVAELMGKEVDDELVSSLLGVFEEGSQGPVFTEKTCSSFHFLLIGIIKNYGRALSSLHGKAQSCREKKTPEEDIINQLRGYAMDVWKYGQLLWRIAYTRMLKLHLRVLNARLRVDKAPPDYAISHDFVPFELDEGPDSDEVLNSLENNDSAYIKWMRIQSSYIASTDVLSVFCANSQRSMNSTLTLSLICAKHSGAKTPTWDYITQIIKEVTNESMDALDIIRNLEKHIDAAAKDVTTEKESNMVKKFGPILSAHKTGNTLKDFDGPVHCESIIGALKKNKTFSADLLALCEVGSSL